MPRGRALARVQRLPREELVRGRHNLGGGSVCVCVWGGGGGVPTGRKCTRRRCTHSKEEKGARGAWGVEGSVTHLEEIARDRRAARRVRPRAVERALLPAHGQRCEETPFTPAVPPPPRAPLRPGKSRPNESFLIWCVTLNRPGSVAYPDPTHISRTSANIGEPRANLGRISANLGESRAHVGESRRISARRACCRDVGSARASRDFGACTFGICRGRVTCRGHVVDMSWTCRGRVVDVSRTCRGRVVGVSWTCRGRVVGVSRVSWACPRRAARRANLVRSRLELVSAL